MSRGWLMLAACGLLGCAHAPPPQAAAGPGVRLLVPFFPDGTDQCGPSALASVLGYWGKPAEPGRLREEVYLAKLQGSLSLDLLLAARARGLDAAMAHPSVAQAQAELDAGRPLIAFLNQGLRVAPLGHFMVLTGYDDHGFYAHSGLKKDVHVPYAAFLKQWERTDRWALMVSGGLASRR